MRNAQNDQENIFPTQHSNLGQDWDLKVTGHDNLKLGQYCKCI